MENQKNFGHRKEALSLKASEAKPGMKPGSPESLSSLNLLKIMAEIAVKRLKSADVEEIHAMIRSIDKLGAGAMLIKDKEDTTDEEKKICDEILQIVNDAKQRFRNN